MHPHPFAGPILRLLLAGLALAGGALAVPVSAAALKPGQLQPQGLFEKNQGQYAPEVVYRGRFPRLDAAIHADGSATIYPRGDAPRAESAIKLMPIAAGPEARQHDPSLPAEYRTHYFRGGEAGAIVDVPHYARVTFPSAYKGIDLAYHAEAGKFEFDFIVAPGADPAQIRLRIEGASALRIDSQGDLAIESGGRVALNRRPVAYQVKGELRVPVKCDYVLHGDRTVAIALGKYDRTAQLVIDPVVEYSSYLGGTADDVVSGVAVGPGGFIYVTGTTNSSNFPAVAAIDGSLSGFSDVFVTKINPANGNAMYSTYLGGRDADSGGAIAVDSTGAAYIAGIATSRFPVTTGAYRTTASGEAGYITKLNSTGNALAYSTLLPGTRPAAIKVDAQFRAVVAGAAGTLFTTTAGSAQPAYGGSTVFDPTRSGDAFALMINPTGTALVFGTFFGGNETDAAKGVAIDTSGRIAIAGSTTSANLAMVSPIQASLLGAEDGFIAVLSSNGTSLLASTYFGGSRTDGFTGLSADPYGNLVASGRSWSDDLPTLSARLPRSALQLRWGELRKGFVAKFSTVPLQLKFSTFTGSNANCCETTFGVATDAVGDIYVSGAIAVSEFFDFQQSGTFLSKTLASAKFGNVDVRQASYAAGYSRDGQALRYQTLVAPCYDSQDCFRGPVGAGAPGFAAFAGDTDIDWLPVAAARTQPKIASSPFISDAWVMTLVTESPALQLATSTTATAPSSPVTLTATSYSAGASGTVTFWDDTVSLGTAPLVEGVARLDTSFGLGVKRVTATLNSDRTPLRLIAVSPVNACQ